MQDLPNRQDADYHPFQNVESGMEYFETNLKSFGILEAS